MRNLLIHIHPEKRFFSHNWLTESEVLIKVQIDNSLALGWQRNDILLITNFDYEYNGVKAVLIGDENYYKIKPTASKVNAIITLFEKGLINDELFWFHDIDAFQLAWITEEELQLDNFDMGITEYGRTTINEKRDERLSTGTIFFKYTAKDIFKKLQKDIFKYQINEEVALLQMMRLNKCNINERMKKLNITYNFATRKRDIAINYERALKPLRVIHFHPTDKRSVELGQDNMSVCVAGKNSLNKKLVTEQFCEILNYHIGALDA